MKNSRFLLFAVFCSLFPCFLHASDTVFVKEAQVPYELLTQSGLRNWSDGRLSFYYMQLSSNDKLTWGCFRDSQRRLMQEIPAVGMAMSSDKGDSLDAHLKDKKAVSERLVYWALNRTYGRQEVHPSGSLFRRAEFHGVSFGYGESMCNSDGGPLRSFEVVEADGEGLPTSAFRAETPDGILKVAAVRRMQGFPQGDRDFAKGVSACFAGITDGQLLMAGGCNFPKVSAAEGGTKRYYDDIYVADASADSILEWRKAGTLPQPVAYGVSVSTSDGIICVGGMNAQGALSAVCRIQIEKGKARMEPLPALPCTLDNMTGCMLGNHLFVAGGNKNGVPSNAFYCLDLEKSAEGWRELPPFPGPPRVQPVCAGQKDEDGKLAFYLWGGFAAPTNGRPASLSVDGYMYSPLSGEWTPLPAPVNERGEAVSLGGGGAIAWGDSLILCMGGVHKDIFLQALRQADPGYLSQPVEWYRFNDRLLVYNTRQRRWQAVILSDRTARAGAAFVADDKGIFCINGELKPGVRTSEITRLDIL